MRKITAFILAAGLCASLLPLSVSAAESTNLALDAEPICAYSHEDANWGWGLANLNNGNVIETFGALGHGSGAGYHSGYGTEQPDPQYVGYNFGAKKTFNTMIVYPISANTFPVDFEIQVSNDGESWTTVLQESDYEIATSAGYCPQTFSFDTQEAQYVRLYATKLNNDGTNYAMKLTEVEVYNITVEEAERPANIAAGKPVDSDSHHEDGPWSLAYINDGDRVNLCTNNLDYGQFCGYHTSPSTPRDGGADAHAQFTIELGEGSKFDQVVIYPSHELYSVKMLNNAPDDPSNTNGVFFPSDFKIQVSNDGESWTDVVAKTGYTIDGINPAVFNFEQQTAKYIRFYMENLTAYVKLSEFEVYDTSSASGDVEVEPPVSEQPATPEQPTNPTNPEQPAEPPKTGTMLPIFILLAGASVAGICLAHRKRYN